MASRSQQSSRSQKSAKRETIIDPKKRDKFGMNEVMAEAVRKKYKVLSVIGKGSYGCVSKGICRKTGKEVALKVMQ